MDKQPLNTGEQKDMTEFFTDLIGKIEEMSSVLVRKLCVVNPHGNERNIVGQRLQTLLGVTCCVRLHTVANCCVLLGVVAQNLKLVKLLRQYLPTFL